MKICVIGGNGYLGHHVTNYFNAISLSRSNGFDITNKSLMSKLNDYDVIILMAALVDKGEENSKKIFTTNAQGTKNVVKALNKRQTLIYTSTKEVYTPDNSYARSKKLAEEYIKSYSKDRGFKYGIFRLSTTYAPPTHGSTFVNFFIKSIKEGKELSLLMKGEQKRDFLYIDDLSNAFEKYINLDLNKKIYDIGGGEKNSTSILGLVRIIEVATQKKAKINFSDKEVKGQIHYVTDISKISSEMGWEPKIGIEEGIKKLI